jgi:hypothetical protein
MRVELIYTPGCKVSRKTLDNLQTVIAEEQLPIPVEVIERNEHLAHNTIRIDGDELCDLPVVPQGPYCRLYATRSGVSGVPCMEALREVLFRKWKELTEAPLLRFRTH